MHRSIEAFGDKALYVILTFLFSFFTLDLIVRFQEVFARPYCVTPRTSHVGVLYIDRIASVQCPAE